MSEFKVPNVKNNCPNCGNNHFGGFGGADNQPPYAILISASKNNNGNYIPDNSKVLGVQPIICDKCGYVMLFRADSVS